MVIIVIPYQTTHSIRNGENSDFRSDFYGLPLHCVEPSRHIETVYMIGIIGPFRITETDEADPTIPASSGNGAFVWLWLPHASVHIGLAFFEISVFTWRLHQRKAMRPRAENTDNPLADRLRRRSGKPVCAGITADDAHLLLDSVGLDCTDNGGKIQTRPIEDERLKRCRQLTDLFYVCRKSVSFLEGDLL